MTAALWVSIVIVGNSRTTLERTNIENAKDISAQYKNLNDDLKEEIEIKFIAMDKKIKKCKKLF